MRVSYLNPRDALVQESSDFDALEDDEGGVQHFLAPVETHLRTMMPSGQDLHIKGNSTTVVLGLVSRMSHDRGDVHRHVDMLRMTDLVLIQAIIHGPDVSASVDVDEHFCELFLAAGYTDQNHAACSGRRDREVRTWILACNRITAPISNASITSNSTTPSLPKRFLHANKWGQVGGKGGRSRRDHFGPGNWGPTARESESE